MRENDEHSRKFCLRAKVSQFDLCERVNFHFAVNIPAKAACPQTAREKKRKNTIIIIYYILYIIYIYSSFSQKKFLLNFSGDFGGFSGDFSRVENVACFSFLRMFFVLFFAFLKSWPFYPRLTKNFQSFVSSLPHLLYLLTHIRLLALFFNPKKCRGRTRKMAVKLYRIINASKTCKGRAAWRFDEVLYPASLPCNPVTPDELQAAIWKQLEEEPWFPPIVAFEWHDGNLYLVQHPRNNSTVQHVLTAWRKTHAAE